MRPPSAGMTAPVIMRDSSDARNNTMLAMSSGSPMANGWVSNPIATAVGFVPDASLDAFNLTNNDADLSFQIGANQT